MSLLVARRGKSRESWTTLIGSILECKILFWITEAGGLVASDTCSHWLNARKQDFVLDEAGDFSHALHLLRDERQRQTLLVQQPQTRPTKNEGKN